eukprot:2006696-Pleurochrysis_carterae.AAC.2
MLSPSAATISVHGKYTEAGSLQPPSRFPMFLQFDSSKLEVLILAFDEMTIPYRTVSKPAKQNRSAWESVLCFCVCCNPH